MIELDLFPTLVILKKGFINFSILDRLRKLKPVMSKHKSIKGDGVSSYSNYYDIIKNDEELRYKINFELKNMSMKLGIPSQKIHNSWINIQNEGSFLSYHKHAQSNISGVIYIDVDKGCSPLKFLNPNPYIFMQSTRNPTKYNYEYVDIQPENGSLILFPSWLSHGSEFNKTIRKVLSFNSRDDG